MTSRPPLSLTAELEKLEQCITLTLQEIDHNFSKAHHIVTTSIIPIVERYAKESESVWEGSKFWKQFFEASANVALSNYQEDEGQAGTYHEEANATTATQHTYTTASSPGNYGDASTRTQVPPQPDQTVGEEDDTAADNDEDGDDYLLDDSLLDSLNLTSHARPPQPDTPRATTRGAQTTTKTTTRWEPIDSPFDALRKELASGGRDSSSILPPPPRRRPLDDSSSLPPPPSTPQPTRHLAGPNAFEATPDSSPFLPLKTPVGDQLLHRVLDKNWRLQATPIGKPTPSRYRSAMTVTPKARAVMSFPPDSESPLSSPPKTHYYDSDIFSSPIKFDAGGGGGGGKGGPKTPLKRQFGGRGTAVEDDDDDDDGGDTDDSDFDLPRDHPVTIQFSLPPSKLLATPAREASRRIVHDILQTAGAADESGATDSSPPVVRAMDSTVDDTF